MAKTKTVINKDSVANQKPAMTPGARENQMIALSMDLAEQQLRDGTASSQIIAHFLKLGSQREKLERERLEEENKLLRAKTEALQSAKNIEELYSNAIAAMQEYKGEVSPDYVEDDY